MLLFKDKSNKQHEPPEGSIMDKAAHAVARTIISWQEKVAHLLGRKFMALSRRAKRGSLLLFCLLYGGTCLWLLEQAMHTNPREAAVPAIRRALPGYLERPAGEKASLHPGLNHKEFQHLQQIR